MGVRELGAGSPFSRSRDFHPETSEVRREDLGLEARASAPMATTTRAITPLAHPRHARGRLPPPRALSAAITALASAPAQAASAAAAAPAASSLAFNLGTSAVLVPAYLALLALGRRRIRLVDRIWSPPPTRHETTTTSSSNNNNKDLLPFLLPFLLGSAFLLSLVGAPCSTLLDLSRSCWTNGIPALQALLRDPAATALVWTQITFLDFLVARHVLRDREAGVPWRHSVALCFVVGPAGLLSHLLTKALFHTSKRKKSRGR
ncbi:hypothetical protein HOP50_02g14790 [Chloropicon primus]|uniref:DUF4281 domain-containing protein n=1 Tax=Chloropicon primus TaxID=1764295 RepID=A0A5B8MHX7_9CHLO|nr:hypothetical protein A3770_02p14900 [Chloropicon primus]UPQ98180.1 hypothetical protein HOP50_02g14790 [Chloropicon primus]|eukprot:QDZ18972.1 hypothetical protein A3770_02p14900 [Chloropicon primus]